MDFNAEERKVSLMSYACSIGDVFFVRNAQSAIGSSEASPRLAKGRVFALVFSDFCLLFFLFLAFLGGFGSVFQFCLLFLLLGAFCLF